jgi:hypothetical protein
MSLIELLVIIIGVPIIVLMAWAVDKKKKNEASDYFTLDDDDF